VAMLVAVPAEGKTSYRLHFVDQYGRALCAHAVQHLQTIVGHNDIAQEWPLWGQTPPMMCAVDGYTQAVASVSASPAPGAPPVEGYIPRVVWGSATLVTATTPIEWSFPVPTLANAATFDCANPSPAESVLADNHDDATVPLTVVFQCATPPPPPPIAPCKVTALVGKSLAAARAEIVASHCELGTVRYRRTKGSPGRVVGQSVAPGAVLSTKAKIGLSVSRR
jgi:hypothetical protein